VKALGVRTAVEVASGKDGTRAGGRGLEENEVANKRTGASSLARTFAVGSTFRIAGDLM
jgi:hypothetical protein